ncbi:23573_t:CDS:2, partial [Gigaspora margarita]
MPFKMFNAAIDKDVREFWKKINLIDDTIMHDDYKIKNLKQQILVQFVYYLMSCKIFTQLYNLSDLIPGVDSYYKSFEELYGTQTIEKYRSLYEKQYLKQIYSNKRIDERKSKYTIPFCPSVLHAKKVGITVSCAEYDKPRLLFSGKKLLEKDCQILSQFLDTILYIYGTAFHNACELLFAIPPRQYYKLNEISKHEYNYKNDSVTSPSNSNQELNIYNINDEGDDNMQNNESSK